MALENGADGGVTEAVAKLDELASDALVAPAGVPPRQSHDEGLDLGGDGWAAARLRVPDGPLAADQLTMPLQYGLRLEQEQDRVQAGAWAGGQVRELGRQHGEGELLPAR